jgi:hypothetical protein
MKNARQITIAVCMAAIVLCSWLGPLDAPATEQVDAGLKRALVSFATARALNGVISVVRGTQISAQPFGVGVSLTPGQVLAPLSELVKHFSDLMLAASIAFGIQKVLIAIGSYWLLSLVLSAVALGWTWFYFRRMQPPALLSKAVVILLMLRFAIPLVTIGTDLLSQKFLAAEFTSSQQAIDLSSVQVGTFIPPMPVSSESQGTWDKVKDWIAKGADVKLHFENLKKAAEQAIDHIVKIMVIFLLQTLVIPLLLLWALYGVLRGTFELRRQGAAGIAR